MLAVASAVGWAALGGWAGGAARHDGVGYVGAIIGGCALVATIAAVWAVTEVVLLTRRGLHRAWPRSRAWPPPGFARWGEPGA